MTGGSSADSYDPNLLNSLPSVVGGLNIYEPLVKEDPQVRPVNVLAEEFTPNKDATVWTIRLRKGVTFHSGKDLTADDLIYSINRILNPKSPGEAATVLTGLKASGMKKLDNLTVSVPFDRPYATFPGALTTNLTIYVLPTGFDPKTPVGTGPFKFESFTPGQQSVLVRNANYWHQPLPYADKVVVTDYSDETSQVNAVLSGAEDAVSALSQESIGTLTGSGKKVLINPGGGFNPITMRVDVAPFNDVRVRQALRLAVNREEMLRLVFGGHGTIGNDIFSIWDPDYDRTIAQRRYDPEQAKSLLKAAGHQNLSVTLTTADIAQGVNNMAVAYAQQAAAAGINIHVNQLTTTAFYGPNYLKWPFAVDQWSYSPYLSQVAVETLPAASYNETHFNNARYNSLYSQALATLDASLRTEIVHEMQMIDYNEGGLIIPFFPPVIDGYGANVEGAVLSKTGFPFDDCDIKPYWLSG
jgi:peptide/nickel transport system substrate-binding protein